MITRPAAVPKQGTKAGDATSGTSGDNAGSPPPATAKETASPPPVSDFSDLSFTQSSLEFQVEVDVDPVDAQAEEAAVLFSNNQDAIAQMVLEGAVQAHRHARGERLWLMLFDLYRVIGQRQPFEALGIEYAQAYEKSPPGWGTEQPEAAKPISAAATPGKLIFKGELLGSNTASFEAVRQAFDKGGKLQIDLSKIKQADAEGCGALLKLLQQARKMRRGMELLGRDALAVLLQGSIETGKAECKECWMLLLELCQLQGRQEEFEELAINFAITFEESPPSWESGRIAAPEPPSQAAVDAAEDGADAYPLRGELKAARFADLLAYSEPRDPLLIDCEKLSRMDFLSAGTLLNVLTSVRGTGKQIVFRHPNHLVAELFRVVGLNAVAAIVFAKR